VLKDRPARLPAAVQQALEQSRLRAEKKHGEDAFREERHLFLTLMDNLPDVVYFKDWEGRFLQINQAMAERFGLAHPFEAIGKTDFDFFSPEHANAAHEDEMEIIRSGKPIVGKEERETWPDGRATWALTTKMPLRDAGGTIIGTFGVSRDITERKRSAESLRESEERFRATFEDAGIGMALVDTHGKAFKTNSAFRKLLRYSEEEVCSMPFTEYTHPHDRALDWDLYSELAGGNRERYEIEKRLIEKSGEIVTGLLTVSLVKDRNGNPLCAMRMTQDVTERKHAEAALRESEGRYRALFERNLAGVFITTWDGRVLDCNQAMAGILGFASPQQALNLRVSDLYVDPEDRATFLAGLEADGRLTNYEMHLRRQDGKVVWLIGNISLLPQTSTGLRIIEGTLIDVTDRKLAEAETRRLAQIVNSSDDAIFSATPEGFIDTWNAGAERMFGYSAAEIAGKHFTALLPKERQTALADSATRLLRGEVIHQHESDHIRKDGSIFPVMLTLSPVRDDKGRVNGVSGIARDVTERRWATEALRQSEEKYRSIVTNIPDVVWTLDANLHFAFISRNIEKMSGFSVDDIARRGPELFLASLHPDDLPKVQEGPRALFAEGRPYDVEARARREDGEWIWVHDRAVATYEKDGMVFADGLLSDITERKRAEQALRDSEERFRQIAETIDEVFWTTDPTTSNMLYISPAYERVWGRSRQSLYQNPRSFLDSIHPDDGARVLAALEGHRRQVLAPQILDLNSSVANLGKMLRRLIGEDIRFRTVLASGLGRVKVDPGQIEQIIINLAVNARDAMEKGGDLVIETGNVELDENYVSKHPTAIPGPHVMLAVSDTGTGMSPETQARIFEPFFTTKGMGKGTGLGLASVYGIVKQSGGNVWVYSELGKGTVFKVYFPLVAENPEEIAPVGPGTQLSSGTETILLVEDEEGVASLVRVALAAGGYTVLEARDADTALAICNQHPGNIHLLLSDVVMPQMSGPAVAVKISALRPGIKVLFMSGYTDDSVVHHGVLSENMPFIQKPFTPEGLRRKIRDVLGVKHA
jgi:two-component system, cell cycle sensor histidine kinase and response regulator CckA